MPRDATQAAPPGARRLRAPTLPAVPERWRPAVADAWRALWVTRVAVWLSSVGAIALWGTSPRADAFDPGDLTRPYGAFADALVAPMGRWDSVWYLAIAQGGYPAADARRPAFFPLYPWLVRLGGAVTGAPLIAGALLSTACFAAALVVLHRLAELELGPEAARWTVWALALFPMSFFFSAVYAEALFLLLSVAAVYAARTGRWAWAGVLGGLAAGTRSAGLVLVVGLALMWFQQRDRRVAQLAWLALVPAAQGAFCALLALRGAEALAPFHAQALWYRSFAGPFVGLWDGGVAAVAGVRQLVHGPAPPVYFAPAGGDPVLVARFNLMLFAFALPAIGALVGALRRLRAPYGAYALAAIALPLSYPVAPQPLMSLPRFEAVLFPLFLWAGWWLARGGRVRRAVVLGGSGILLVAFSAQFATWHWVA
ncbi:MAG: glycosyltransferase family 39 protein [Actinomycetota bacterium]|nr:glycosyltransferase family 39 protein [Actinomycetota bacterium]